MSRTAGHAVRSTTHAERHCRVPQPSRLTYQALHKVLLVLCVRLTTGIRGLHQDVHLPVGFNWQIYLKNYPELKSQVKDEEDAKQHWLQYGAAEGRVHRPVHKMLRYTACTGLFNQYYSHISALALAASINSDVLFPPAATRSSYSHTTNLDPKYNEAKWQPVPAESLWDTRRLRRYWQQQGLIIQPPTELEPFPDLASGASAFQQLPLALPAEAVVRMDGTYINPLPLDVLMQQANALLMERARQLLNDKGGQGPVSVLLDLPCTFFSLQTTTAFPLVQEVVHSLTFAPIIQGMARRVIQGVTEGGAVQYNSVHLRVERDAEVWASIMGGQEAVWQGYEAAMTAAEMTGNTKLYIASALLTYGAESELKAMTTRLQAGGYAASIHHKEMYLPARELEALHSEQVALLDFIVCAGADRFVGFGASTFSFFMREYRLLHGKPRNTSQLVNASVITTDPLFYAAGLILPFP